MGVNILQQDYVARDGWVVFGRKACPWCDKVKDLLTLYQIPFYYYDIDIHNLRDELKRNGFNTVPQVFRNGRNIGGYEATEKFLEVIL